MREAVRKPLDERGEVGLERQYATLGMVQGKDQLIVGEPGVGGVKHCPKARDRVEEFQMPVRVPGERRYPVTAPDRSEEHTSELQSLMRISYAVFCLKKKTVIQHILPRPSSHNRA